MGICGDIGLIQINSSRVVLAQLAVAGMNGSRPRGFGQPSHVLLTPVFSNLADNKSLTRKVRVSRSLIVKGAVHLKGSRSMLTFTPLTDLFRI